MRKANSEVKPLMNRIENLARKEHRNIVGQLTHILEVYEKTTGITGKRPYNRKPKELAQEKELKKKVVARKGVAVKGVMKHVQLSLLDPVERKRKVRSDKGGTHNMSEKGRKRLSSAVKMRFARQRLLNQKAAH